LNILLNKKYNNGVCELFPSGHVNFQSCTSCQKCRRLFDYYEVCQLFTWIFPFKYPVYTLIRYANKQRFFPLKLNKWFGVLQEYSIINNILLYDIQIGGVDCTMHSHGTIVGVMTMLMGGA
jgi:hypothetical protein